MRSNFAQVEEWIEAKRDGLGPPLFMMSETDLRQALAALEKLHEEHNDYLRNRGNYDELYASNARILAILNGKTEKPSGPH